MSYPLFPLNTVLFPGCTLDLQIFEARYLDMISTCMRSGESFGVVAILDGKEVGEAVARFADIGCEALIRDFQQMPNGLLGIRVEGGQRFRVHSAEVRSDQLTVADVEWLAESEDLPLQSDQADLAALLAALAQHPQVKKLDMDGEACGQQELSNRLAYLLPFKLEQKLQLLEIEDAAERLQVVQALVEALQGGMQA